MDSDAEEEEGFTQVEACTGDFPMPASHTCLMATLSSSYTQWLPLGPRGSWDLGESATLMAPTGRNSHIDFNYIHKV